MDDMPYDLVVRGRRVLTPGGTVPAQVGVRNGRIAAVVGAGTHLEGSEVVDLADDEVLIPGLVDSHVHINDPGRTSWEGFATATRAAAAGGVTTVVDMPLNSIPPTIDAAALEIKRDTARPAAFVDVGFWGGAVPENLGHLRELHDAGVFGVKCFLLESGVPEFGHLGPAGLRRALRELAELDGMLIVHAEDGGIIAASPPCEGRSYADFLASRPPESESSAITDVIAALRETGGRAHIVHLSDASALPVIARAREEGLRLTVETCPHYLTLNAEDVPDGATAYKCCPPIRDSNNRDRLWQGLQAGTIDVVVTDHSPSTLDLKELDTGHFGRAWGGISSLQLGLAVVWTAARQRGIALEEVVGWMSSATAGLLGLGTKGGIEVGKDADLAVLAPEETFAVDPARLHHKNPITPYAGKRLHGVVRRTLLRGRPITETPHGVLLRRGEA